MPDLKCVITRRRLLAGMLASAVLAACSGPRSLRNDVDTPLDAREPGVPVESQEDDGATSTPADLQASNQNRDPTKALQASPEPQSGPSLTAEPSPTAEPTVSQPVQPTATVSQNLVRIRTPYAAVVSPRLPVRKISFEDLNKLWSHEWGDWEILGDPDASIVKRISLAGDTGPMSLADAQLEIPSLDEMVEFLRYERGGLAFIPRDQVDHRFRTLRVDGHNILASRSTEPPDDYPLLIEHDIDPSQHPHLQEPRPEPVSITAVGDIIFGRYVHMRLASIGDFAASFRAIHEHINWSDVTIGDLECSLSDTIPQPEEENPHTFLFKSATACTDGLKLGGIDVLSRANNHSFNFHVQGMEDTTSALDEAGILHFGMGHSLDEARRATVVEVRGSTFAFLGYNGISDFYDGATPRSAGTNPMQEWLVTEDIAREKARGHVVIPYFHWGTEYVADPTEQQRYFAHLAIDAGAAMVLGSHPHWVQATEVYKGKPIIYSLGNFIFDQSWSNETMQGMYATIWMEGEHVLEIDLAPYVIREDHRPEPVDVHVGKPILERVWEASDRLVEL